MYSISAIIISISFFLLMMISFYGVGYLIKLFLLPSDEHSFGQIFALGFVIFLVYSSYLEVFHLGSPIAFYAFMGLGLTPILLNFKKLVKSASCFVCNFEITEKSGNWDTLKIRLIALLILISFVFLYLINLIFLPFNFGDDYQSYAVFPIRILIEGFQGGDPFNLRGIEHGLGAGNSLNAFFLSGSQPAHLHLGEAGTGFLLLLALITGYLIEQRQKYWVILAGALLACIAAIFPQQTNVTPILSGCAIALAVLFLGTNTSQSKSWHQSACLGLYLGSLAALKGNLLIPAAVFGMAIVIYQMNSANAFHAIRNFIIMAASGIICLLPWMIASLHSHGTLFYPILGKGFSNSEGFGIVSLSEYQNAISEFLPLYGLMLSAWLLLYTHAKDRNQRIFSTILVISVIIFTMIIAITPAGMFRYNYVILATPTLYLLSAYLGLNSKIFFNQFFNLSAKHTKILLILCVTASNVMMVLETKRVGRHLFNDGIFKRLIKIDQQILENKDFRSSNFRLEQKRHLDLQESIPAGQLVLTQVNAPILLNFKRNPILIMDYPGSVGPKPGFPYNADPETIAQYLRDQKIRYLAHSYEDWKALRNDPYFINFCLNAAGQWGRTMATRQLHVNEKMLQLANQYQIVFDNGQDRVIDLCSPLTKHSISLCFPN